MQNSPTLSTMGRKADCAYRSSLLVGQQTSASTRSPGLLQRHLVAEQCVDGESLFSLPIFVQIGKINFGDLKLGSCTYSGSDGLASSGILSMMRTWLPGMNEAQAEHVTAMQGRGKYPHHQIGCDTRKFFKVLQESS